MVTPTAGTKKWPKRIAIAFLPSVALLGWLSNAFSTTVCQQRVGKWLFVDVVGERPFFLVNAQDEQASAAFDSIGASYSSLPVDANHPSTWPRISMKSHAVIPFLVSVDYFWEREPLLGGGATKWFFCFFGLCGEIGETDRFST